MKPGFTEPSVRTGSEGGVALVVVLWVLTLISLLILTLGADIRTNLLIVQNQEAEAQAKAIADSGVTLALLGLFDPSPATQWRADGSTHVLSYQNGSIHVSVQDERGKVDLNTAPVALLASLFETLGVDDAPQLASEIGSRRLPDASETVSLANPPLPGPNDRRSEPFLTVDDLRSIPGVTPAVYDSIAPYVTVLSGRAQIDPFTAAPVIVRSLPGVDQHEVEIFLAERAGMSGYESAPLPLTGVGRFIFHGPLQTFTIQSDGQARGGAHFVRQATATLTGIPDAPYRFLSWRELHPDASAAKLIE